MTFVSTEGKCKSEQERKVSAKIADERKAAENLAERGVGISGG